MRFLGVDDGLVEYHFKPNLPVVGKKYGRRVPAIKATLAALEGETAGAAARAVAAGQPVRVEVEGEPLDLAPDEVLVEAGGKEGLTEDQATRMVSKAMSATGGLLELQEPGALKRAVASPGGMTEAGLNALEERKIREILMAAVDASLERVRK